MSLADLRAQNESLKQELARLEALAKEVSEQKLSAALPGVDPSATSIQDPSEIKQVFDGIDTDGSGFIDRDELVAMAHRLGEVLDDDEIAAAMQEMDGSQQGRISFQEFFNWWVNPDRARVSKTAVKIGMLRARIISSALLKGAPKLLRALSENKEQVVPEDSTEWMKHNILLSIGDLKDPKASAHLTIDFRKPSTAGFEKFPGCGMVMRVNLVPRPGQTDAQRAASIAALAKLIPDEKNQVIVSTDTSNPAISVLGIGIKGPDPMETAVQLNLDVANFVKMLSIKLDLGHSIGEFIDPSLPGGVCLAGMIQGQFSIDTKLRKALLFTLAQFPLPQVNDMLPLAWLETLRLQLCLGDAEKLFRSFRAQQNEGNDLVAEVMRVQQAQIKQFEDMGMDPQVIAAVRQEQTAQLAQIQSITSMSFLRREFWLDDQFRPKLREMYYSLVMSAVSAQENLGTLFDCLKNNFVELSSVTCRSPGGLDAQLALRQLLVFKYLPPLTKDSAGCWKVVTGESE